MKKLIAGIIDFRKKHLCDYRKKFAQLALRQTPDALFVACCDSRVVPNVFASSDPGDLFVLRNIGNLIPPYVTEDDQKIYSSVAATIEFSLASLKVRDIVICGHSDCGAMKAIMAKSSGKSDCLPLLDRWLTYANSSYERFKKMAVASTDLSPCNLLSRINVLQQLENLKTYPLVMKQIQENKLRIHGWWFDLATANVFYYDQNADEFILVDEKTAKHLLSE